MTFVKKFNLKKYSYALFLVYITVIYRFTAEWHLYSKSSMTNMTTELDFWINKYIGYHGSFVYIYLSYFIVMLIPLLLKESERSKMALRMFIMSSMAHIFFIFLPSYITRYPMAFFDSAAYDKHLLGLIYQYDLNLNCFPTLHAAHVLLIAFMFPKNELHLNRLFLKIWACLITASTMIIRQHSAADILGAITIVVIAIEIEKKWLRKLFQTPG